MEKNCYKTIQGNIAKGQTSKGVHIYLNEANFLGVASEALTATHEAVLPDQSMGVTTHTAGKQGK